MPRALKENNERWTYADYLTWPDDERWELIYGKAYNQSPVSQVLHKRVADRFFEKFSVLLDRKKREVFIAPLDVIFSEVDEQNEYCEKATIVQPDIFVINDIKRFSYCGYNGPPELIVEITTPESQSDDLNFKFDLYEKHGVKEYWIVYPVEQVLMVYVFENDGFCKPKRYACFDKVFVSHLGNLVIDLRDVFAKEQF